MSKNNQNNPAVIVCHMGTISTAGDYPVAHLPKRFILKQAYLMDKVGSAADATNFVTCTLKNGATTIGSIDTDSGGGNDSLVANTALSMGLTADYDAAAASDLKMTYAEGGTGTLTDAKLILYGFFL